MKLIIIVLVSLFALARGQQEPVCSETDQYLPHHECQKYYICDNRVPVEQECPETLYWNQEEQYCDFQVNVPECKGDTRPPPGSSTVTTPTQTTTTQTITTARTTIVTGSSPPPTAAPGQCPSTGIVRIPHPDFCEKYYQCVDGLRIEATCTSGFYFDIKFLDCNFAEVVDCGNRATPGPPTTTVPTVTTTVPTTRITTTVPTTRVTTTVPTTRVTTTVPTTRVTTTVPTTRVTTTVPTTRVTTVPTTTRVVTSSATTRPPGPPSCPATGVVYLPYPGDCSLYLICVEGSGSIYRCPSGQLFDRVDLYCVNAVDARCA